MEKQMKDNPNYNKEREERAEKIYFAKKDISCPYFQSKVILTSEGFHHLRYSSNRERNKKEQILKFNLLPLALRIIANSGTIQEYRKLPIPVGKKSKDGLRKTKEVEYWGLVAIVSETKIKIKVILKRVGDGNIVFWSVMPYSKLKPGQKLYIDGIEDE
jgi:hypothetical protein